MAWSDEVDEVIGSDLTAALAYATPAGGAVVTPVAPIGLRDRGAGTVGFTTSLGLGEKLERMQRNPRIALAYHAREHGRSSSPGYVLVQGTAAWTRPDAQFMDGVIGPASEPFLGPPRRGRLFWDRWLREYYRERVLVTMTVTRVVSWPDLWCRGDPQVEGEARPGPAAPPARPPARGAGPRLDCARAAGRLARLDHCLLAFTEADGGPVVVPVRVQGSDARGLRLDAAPGLLPSGGRRAGLVGHTYRARLIGLSVQQHTGWLEVADGVGAVYAPHTQKRFVAPPNKTLLLLVNGLLAKRGLRQARRAGREALLRSGSPGAR